MLTKGGLSNFASGVSQQAVALRLPTQSKAEVNTYPAIVDGNKKRPPTEFVAAVSGVAPSTSAFSHFMVRDDAERYLVVIESGDLKVVDLQGNARTVNFPNGKSYLSTPMNSDVSFDALTIADYTFIVNKTVTTAMDSAATAPERPHECLINVAAGNYGKTYAININSSRVATYSAPSGVDGDAPFIDTTYIAAQLTTALTTGGPTGVSVGYGPGVINPANGWSVTRYGNAIHIASLTGADFSVSIEDGYNGNAMKVAKGKVQRFSDLPSFGPQSLTIAVVGDQGNASATYYVQFEVQNPANSQGIWKECPKPGYVIGLDAGTMPYILVRNPDGTFTFKRATWNQRTAGDETTSPNPSFVGQQLNSITFYKNRLTLLAGGNLVASKASDFFNFFRMSAVTLLDDDPIDINASSTKVAYLRAATPYQQSLVCWTDLEQLTFSGNDLLTPKSANMNSQSQYESLAKTVKPVASPRRIFFCMDRNGHVAVREWYNDMYYHISTADEASSHVPTFIPSGVFKMALSNIDDVLVVASTADRSSLWVYKYYWSGQDKIQSAWIKWQFPGASILNVEFINGVLYLLMQRGGTAFLEKVRMSPNLDDGDGVFPTLLDRRVATGAGGYDAATDTTSYVMPYTPDPSRFKAATRSGGGISAFIDWPATVTGTTVTLKGDTRGYSFYFGETYEMRYTFSPQFVRAADGSGQSSTLQEGRLQILKMDLSYSNAGYFRVEVTPPGRQKYTYEFSAQNLDDNIADLDSFTPRTGVFTFPVMSKSDDVLIEIINDSFLPASFIRAEWKGNFVPKSRK